MPRRRERKPVALLTIAGATTLLGVTPPTLRRSDESSKFPGRMQPINSYRQCSPYEAMKLRHRMVFGKRAA